MTTELDRAGREPTMLAWGTTGSGPPRVASRPGCGHAADGGGGPGDIDTVGADDYHFAALRRDGTVHSWGADSAGSWETAA
jgi:Regulator of chromosome condensation (RCC1) repeat